MINLRSVKELEGQVKNKRVFLRADLDAPLILSEPGEWVVGDDFRLNACLPTLGFLSGQGAVVVVAGHLGRPEGRVIKALSLERLLPFFRNHFPSINFLSDIFAPGVFEALRKSPAGQVILLENLRFYPGEEINDPGLALKLATLADVYVNDAFANCHRPHASMVGLPKRLPSYAGFHLQKEVEALSRVFKNPARPLFVVIGGGKVETKLPLVKNFLDKADRILVGGAAGCQREILEFLQIPEVSRATPGVDGLDSGSLECPKAILEFACGDPDLGFNAAKKWAGELLTARTIIWNGPMGDTSRGQFAGTELIAQAVVGATKNGAYSVVGGGDTEVFLRSRDFDRGVSFLSVGGGAMLDFLSGSELPGLTPLIIT